MQKPDQSLVEDNRSLFTIECDKSMRYRYHVTIGAGLVARSVEFLSYEAARAMARKMWPSAEEVS